MYFLLLTAATLSRFLPHAANFTPIGGILIFSSKKYGIKKSILLGLVTMLISDTFIGFSFVSPFVYIGFLGYILSARILKVKYIGLLLAPLAGSFFFFVISNLGVFLGPWYEHSFSGLIKCFILALPFYRNTLAGDLIFTLGIFAIMKIVEKIMEERKIWLSTFQKKIFKRM